jgi:hypothetical protein
MVARFWLSELLLASQKAFCSTDLLNFKVRDDSFKHRPQKRPNSEKPVFRICRTQNYSKLVKKKRKQKNVRRVQQPQYSLRLKVSGDGVTKCIKLFFWILSTVQVSLKPQRFGSWLYYRHRVKGGQKPNLLGSVVQLDRPGGPTVYVSVLLAPDDGSRTNFRNTAVLRTSGRMTKSKKNSLILGSIHISDKFLSAIWWNNNTKRFCNGLYELPIPYTTTMLDIVHWLRCGLFRTPHRMDNVY